MSINHPTYNPRYIFIYNNSLFVERSICTMRIALVVLVIIPRHCDAQADYHSNLFARLAEIRKLVGHLSEIF